MTLHIRGVGQWTNRLFDYVEAKKKEEGLIVRQNTVKKRGKNMKNEDQLIEHPVEQTNGKMHLDMTFSDARPIEQKQDPKGPSINYVVSLGGREKDLLHRRQKSTVGGLCRPTPV